MNIEYLNIRRAKVTEVLDRFPDLPSRTLARVLVAEVPEMFESIERARTAIRYLRGTHGKDHFKILADRRYVKSLQPSR